MGSNTGCGGGIIKVACDAIERAGFIVKTVVVLIKVSTFRATGVPGSYECATPWDPANNKPVCMPRNLRLSQVGWRFLMSEIPLYMCSAGGRSLDASRSQ